MDEGAHPPAAELRIGETSSFQRYSDSCKAYTISGNVCVKDGGCSVTCNWSNKASRPTEPEEFGFGALSSPLIITNHCMPLQELLEECVLGSEVAGWVGGVNLPQFGELAPFTDLLPNQQEKNCTFNIPIASDQFLG